MNPTIHIPEGSATCRVSVINTTCDLTCRPELLIEPKIAGHDWLNLPTFSFHIKHDQTGDEILFDLGCRKDWWNMVPHLAEVVSNMGQGMRITNDVVDILSEGKVDVSKTKALILSHWHYDHCGNLSTLPKTVDLVVGPGFKESFLPGYPTSPKSPFWESDFADRQVTEIAFNDDLKIGQLQAHDYFGDGSLYILNTPGHAVGHIAALVRTSPNTFVLLGGDICHFTGVFRPSDQVPMPDIIPDVTPLDRLIARPCPCSAFTASHPDPANSQTSPWYRVSTGSESWYVDPVAAQESLSGLVELDADPNILVLIAHDPTMLDVLPFFPNATINNWKQKGWKEALHWGFVNELPYYGQSVRPKLADGLYKEGQCLKRLP